MNLHIFRYLLLRAIFKMLSTANSFDQTWWESPQDKDHLHYKFDKANYAAEKSEKIATAR